MLMMLFVEQHRGITIDKTRANRIESLRLRLNRLTLMRHDEIIRVYSNAVLKRDLSPLPRRRRRRTRSKKSPRRRRPNTAPNRTIVRFQTLTPDQSESPSQTPPESESESEPEASSPPRTPSPIPQLKVKHIVIEPEKTIIDMIPVSFKPSPKTNDDGQEDEDEDDDDDEEKDIIYPDGVIDHHPYIIVARYRRAINESTDFCKYPLIVAEDSKETLMLGLENFAQQHGCDLSFTDNDQRFDKSIYRATCGMIDLGSVHLLASDTLLTANFQFEIDLDYDSDITQSKKNVERFVDKFCVAISQDLSCDQNNVRVFSIDKLAKRSGKSHVNFGLTTQDQKKTEQLASALQVHFDSLLFQCVCSMTNDSLVFSFLGSCVVRIFYGYNS